jgi:hypothetical protein
VSIRSSPLDRPAARRARRLDLGVTSIHSNSSKHRDRRRDQSFLTLERRHNPGRIALPARAIGFIRTFASQIRGLADDRAHLQANENRVDTVDLKDRLCDVQTDRRNCFAYLASPNRGGLNSAHFHWHVCARGRANHTIKSGHSTARLACSLRAPWRTAHRL